MKTIAVMNLKGGVAKTTTTLNLAAILAAGYGKRVLLVDADSQYNLSLHMRADREQNTICALLDGEAYYENIIQETYLRNVDLIPASPELMDYDISALTGGRVNYKAIHDLRIALTEDDAYDYMLIDCPPAFSAASTTALYAADEALIPTTVGLYEQEGMGNLLRQVSGMQRLNPALRVGGVLLTLWHNADLVKQGETYLRQHLPVRVFDTVIRRTDKVGESAYYQMPVIDWSPCSAASRDYREFVQEYLGGELGAQTEV